MPRTLKLQGFCPASRSPAARNFRNQKLWAVCALQEEWFKSKLDRRPSHVFDLRTRLDKQILPVFEKEKRDRITVAAVERFRDKLRDEKYAHRRSAWVTRKLDFLLFN